MKNSLNRTNQIQFRAVRLTGPFVTMIYSMLTGDMFTFGIIYTIVLVGFSQAFFFLFKGELLQIIINIYLLKCNL